MSGSVTDDPGPSNAQMQQTMNQHRARPELKEWTTMTPGQTWTWAFPSPSLQGPQLSLKLPFTWLG